jgi:hypothetical protein
MYDNVDPGLLTLLVEASDFYVGWATLEPPRNGKHHCTTVTQRSTTRRLRLGQGHQATNVRTEGGVVCLVAVWRQRSSFKATSSR